MDFGQTLKKDFWTQRWVVHGQPTLSRKTQNSHKMRPFLWSWHRNPLSNFFWVSMWRRLMWILLNTVSWAIQCTNVQSPTPQGPSVVGCLFLPHNPKKIHVFKNLGSSRARNIFWGSKLKQIIQTFTGRYFTGFHMVYVRDYNYA